MSTGARVEDKELVGRKVREALVEAEGDRVTAEMLFHRWMDEDGALLNAVLRPLLDMAVSNVFRQEISRLNRVQWAGVTIKALPSQRDADAMPSSRGLVVMGQQRATALLATYHIQRDGKSIPLGEATADDLRHAINVHRQHVIGNLRVARWYALILNAMGEAEHVADVLSEEEVAAFQIEAVQYVPD